MITRAPALPVLERALVAEAPKMTAANVAACEEGWATVGARWESALS